MRIIRLPDVETKTGLKKSWIYREINRGRFPAQINLSAKAVGWVESDVDNWISNRVAESRRDSA